MPTALAALLVASGSAAGGVARWWLVPLADQRWQERLCGLPVGTLLVNVVGSLLITLIAGLWRDHKWVELLLLTGVMGGFTTFSAFSRQSVDLLHAGRPLLAGLYAAVSVLLCVGAAAGGYALARLLRPA